MVRGTALLLFGLVCTTSLQANHSLVNRLRAAAPPTSGVDSDVAKWFEELADDDFEVREKAMQNLIAKGVDVEPQLERLLRRPDVEPEQRHRSGKIIEAVWDGKKMSWEEVFRRLTNRIQSTRCEINANEYSALMKSLDTLPKETLKKYEDALKVFQKSGMRSDEKVLRDILEQHLAADATGPTSPGSQVTFDFQLNGEVEILIKKKEEASCPLNAIPKNAVLPNGKTGKSFELARLTDAGVVATIPRTKRWRAKLTLEGRANNSVFHPNTGPLRNSVADLMKSLLGHKLFDTINDIRDNSQEGQSALPTREVH